MIVQVVNSGGVSEGGFDIYTPLGGVGDFNACEGVSMGRRVLGGMCTSDWFGYFNRTQRLT
jgi:hypothetical protein